MLEAFPAMSAPSLKHLTFLVVVLLGFGCSRSPAPVAAPLAERLTADELRVARQALPLAEVSLMLRTGYGQNDIIAEVQRRRVSEAPSAVAEANLAKDGASPKLLEALKSQANVLTRLQKEAFDQHRSQVAVQAQQQVARHQQNLQAQQQQQENDRQRRHQLSQQTLANARAAEAKERAYEQNSAAYKARKEALERQIQYVQADINRKRSNGYREKDLLAENNALERYNQELRQLPVPPLR